MRSSGRDKNVIGYEKMYSEDITMRSMDGIYKQRSRRRICPAESSRIVSHAHAESRRPVKRRLPTPPFLFLPSLNSSVLLAVLVDVQLDFVNKDLLSSWNS